MMAPYIRLNITHSESRTNLPGRTIVPQLLEDRVKPAGSLVAVVIGSAWMHLAGADSSSARGKMPAALEVENEQGKPTTLSPEALAKLPLHRAKVTGHSGTPAT